MIAAGYDLPYVQAQVGHVDPAVTLAIYAHVMRRADRDRLRAEIRGLLGVVPLASDGDPRIASTKRPETAARSSPKSDDAHCTPGERPRFPGRL